MESLLRLHPLVPPSPSLKLPPIHRQLFIIPLRGKRNQSRTTTCCSAAAGSSWWEKLKAVDTSLSDVVWPSAGKQISTIAGKFQLFEGVLIVCNEGAFLAMAVLGKMDQIIAPSGLSLTVAPLGAVSTVLFATPAAPGARVSLSPLSLYLIFLERRVSLLNQSLSEFVPLFLYFSRTFSPLS